MTILRNYLAKPPMITDVKETVTTILEDSDLKIKTGHFANSEYEQVRKQIKENKAQGPDSISPEVLKRCIINDIVINFVSNILINNEKAYTTG